MQFYQLNLIKSGLLTITIIMFMLVSPTGFADSAGELSAKEAKEMVRELKAQMGQMMEEMQSKIQRLESKIAESDVKIKQQEERVAEYKEATDTPINGMVFSVAVILDRTKTVTAIF